MGRGVSVVLDSSALLAITFEEEGAEIAGELAGTGRLILGAEDHTGARGRARDMLGQAQESLSQLRSLLEILR